MAVNFEQFYRAIAEQESSNNYKAKGPWVGGDRAYGKYQIMGANLASWGRKFVGHAVSPDEFLNNPDIQEKMARGQLQEYWNKYGGRGAAAAWYSGDPNLQNSTRPQAGGMPSIKEYVDSVMATAATKSGSGGGTDNGGANSGGTYTPPPGRGESAESYGFVEALMNSNSELKSLFDKAVSEQWTPQKFQASLRDTNWWKTHPESERQFLTAQYGDPATAKEKMDQAWIHIRQLANKIGIVETDGNNYQKFNEWAYKAVAFGWNDDRLRAEMARFVSFGETGQQWEGEAGEIMQKLHTYAYQQGVEMDKSWYEQVTRNTVSGENALNDYMDQIRRQAKSLYANWSSQIDAGQLVTDLASPYMQSMATILELPPGSITLFDPTIKKALQYKDPTSGESQIKQIWQFENELRNDERWKKTKNAQDSMFQVAHQVLADFGVKY